MQQLGCHVPDAAKMLLGQEEKFKFYYGQLTHVVQQYEVVMAKVGSSHSGPTCLNACIALAAWSQTHVDKNICLPFLRHCLPPACRRQVERAS